LARVTLPALVRSPRLLVAAALVLFLASHLPSLAPALEDVDSVNFALGVRHFDVAQHQPHPPGYPLFIGLAKLSTAAFRPLAPAGAPSTWPEAHGIAVWGALFGALAALPLFLLFRALDGHAWRAALAVLVTFANPLFWLNASRPLSDVPGLAVTLVAQALLVMAFVRQQQTTRGPAGAPMDRAALIDSGRLFVLGALVAGLAIGLRSQSAWLTTPLLVLVLVDRVGRDVAGALLGGAITYAIGVALWLVPLLVLTGGPAGYLAAVSAQAGEDIAGVDLLATNFTLRRLAIALVHTFVYPWVTTPLATMVLAAAVLGGLAIAWRDRRTLLVLALAVGPYLPFHLGFQESFTTRYALPFVPIVAWLAVRGLAVFGGLAAAVGGAGIVVASLAVGVPAGVAYGREASPLFRALADVTEARQRIAAPEAPPLAMHHAVARSARIEPIAASALPSPSGREWTAVVDYWLRGGDRPVWFLVEPRRTDLARFDPASQRVKLAYRWPVDEVTFVGGARPMTVDWVELTQPGWFVTDGWALTPELAGLAERERRGPSRGGITAWARRRPGEVVLLVGGRNLGAKDEPDVRFTLSIEGRTLQEWSAAPDPGFFLHTWRLSAGTLEAGDGPFAKVAITAEAADGSARPVRASIEQFDVQSPEVAVRGFGPGWHEMEYAPGSGLRWRWTSERARLDIAAPAGVPVELVLSGESPLRYFGRASTVRVVAGSAVLREFQATSDFTERVIVPADALAAAGGHVHVETDQHFVPDERSGNGDRRRLGLRIFDARVATLR
jgi:hypothetical protein